jgi:hypothetical protein
VATTSVTLTHAFPKGTKANAYVRSSDSFSGGQHVISSGQADKDGTVEVKGLTPGALYWIDVEGFDLTYTVQAKDDSWDEDASLHRTGPEATGRRLQADREAQAEARRQAERKDPLTASPAPGRTVVDNKPKHKSPQVKEPQPGPRQDETSGPQRSDTPDGEGTPKDPREHVPQVPQEAIGSTTPQRSSTETGTATVKDPQESVPAAKQSDVPASTPQRSSTEGGEAAPKPKVSGKEVAKRADSSASQARGRSAPKPEEVVKPKATTKTTTKTGTPKRSSNKK